MQKLGILLLLAVLTVLSSPASGDWVNLTGAENAPNILEIHVEEDHVKIKLEVFVRDLAIFEELIPEQMLPEVIPGRPGPEDRMRHFAENTFQILNNNGEKLSAHLDLVEPRLRVVRPSRYGGKINPYTRRLIPGPPEDNRVLYAELIYPFIGKPRSLTFIPPLDPRGFPTASIGFVCYHLDVPVVDFRNLTQQNTLNLDWKDPWYSEFTKKALRRSLQDGMRTFLYIEPYEIRHETLVRVKDMMTWIDFELRGDKFIEEDEFNPVRKKIADFFMNRENVLIDGAKQKPILDRAAFVESSMLSSRFIEIPERVPLNTAMVGVVITYLTNGIPDEVETEWDLFSDRVQSVTGGMTDPAGPFPYTLTSDDNVLHWKNYLKKYTIPTVQHVGVSDSHRGYHVSLLSLGCLAALVPLCIVVYRRKAILKPFRAHLLLIGVLILCAVVLSPFSLIPIGNNARAAMISGEDSRAITLSLLENIYRAFDFRGEEDVYDRLAVSVSGDLLTDIYLQSKKSMVIEQAGGAQAKVKGVEVLEADVKQSGSNQQAIAVRTKWTAIGQVGHWGHVHIRQNVYDAILTLAVRDGSWKLMDMELIEEKRVDPNVGSGK